MDVTHKLLSYNAGPRGLGFSALVDVTPLTACRAGREPGEGFAGFVHFDVPQRVVRKRCFTMWRYYVTEAASHDGSVQGQYMKTLITDAIFSADVEPSTVQNELYFSFSPLLSS